MSRTFVVTGTDTDVGKTVFAAGLAAAIQAHYWKPIQAGLDDGSDAQMVYRLGVPAERILPEAYRLATPCSPHRAAELDDVEIDVNGLRPPAVNGALVIEGAGGVLVPVTRKSLYADLFATWGAPVILVARTQLGTINHSLLSIEALRTRGVRILGIAFVGQPMEDSEATISQIGRTRRLGRLPHLSELSATTLGVAFAQAFDLKAFL